MTSLLDAVKKNSVPITSHLLDYGVDPNSRDARGLTALHFAVERANPDLVELLLSKGADPNLVENEGQQTPLHRAVILGNLRIVELLVAHKYTNVDVADKQGITPLEWAEKTGRGDIIKAVSSARRRSKRVPATLSSGTSRPSSVEVTAPVALPASPAVSAPHSVPAAAPSTQPPAAASPPSLPIGDDEVQLRAGRHGSTSAALSANRSSIFQTAVRKLAGKAKTVRPGATESVSPVVLAAKANDLNDLVQHLNAGEDVDSRDHDGSTALFYAAELGSVAMAALCIERGADVNIRNDAGWTPLHAAVIGLTKDHETVANSLLEAGADIMATNQSGETPLQLATRRNAAPSMMRIIKTAGVHASEMQLRRLLGLPNNGLDSDTAAALTTMLNHMTELQVELEATARYAQNLEAQGLATSPSIGSPEPSASPVPESAVGSSGSLTDAVAIPRAIDGVLSMGGGRPVRPVQCAECIQTQYQHTRLVKENEELTQRSKKLMRSMAKAAQGYEAKIAELEDRLQASEQARRASEEDKDRTLRRMEIAYSSKVTKMLQEMETALHQVKSELEAADQERVDLLNFQKKNKKLTWVPDDAVSFCLGGVCGNKPFDTTRRRHHCRCCGRVFCGLCVSKRMSLPRMGYTNPVRVCDSCFALLGSADDSKPLNLADDDSD